MAGEEESERSGAEEVDDTDQEEQEDSGTYLQLGFTECVQYLLPDCFIQV